MKEKNEELEVNNSVYTCHWSAKLLQRFSVCALHLSESISLCILGSHKMKGAAHALLHQDHANEGNIYITPEIWVSIFTRKLPWSRQNDHDIIQEVPNTQKNKQKKQKSTAFLETQVFQLNSVKVNILHNIIKLFLNGSFNLTDCWISRIEVYSNTADRAVEKTTEHSPKSPAEHSGAGCTRSIAAALGWAGIISLLTSWVVGG